MRESKGFVATLLLLMWFSTRSAAAVFQPAGLSPGDEYQLIFTTEGQRDATVGEFEAYVIFVNAEAARSDLTRDVSWLPIVSLVSSDGTTQLHARDLVPVSAPVYTLSGMRFSEVGLFDTVPTATPNYDQFGEQLNVSWGVATGTRGDGMAQDPLPSEKISVGTNFDLEDNGWIVDDDEPSIQLYHFYAVSDVITVVPEPHFSYFTVIVVGLTTAGLTRPRRTRNVMEPSKTG
jgi:hypothetical protein